MFWLNKSIFENPQIIKYNGIAKLYQNDYEIDVEFSYYLINETGVLFCSSNKTLPLKQKFDLEQSKWKIEGFTEKGERFRSLDLLLTNFDGNTFFEFVQQKGILIGEIIKGGLNDCVTYWIFNLYNLGFGFDYEGFKIIIEKISNYDQELITNYWQIPQFGSKIKLVKKEESHEVYTTLINSIVISLSLSTGKSLSFPLMEVEKDLKTVKLLNNARSTIRKIQRIIPIEETVNYLVEVLPYFKKDFDRKYKELRTLLEYIHDTDIGYLDDRILSIIQAWEILSNNYGNSYEIPEEIKELKKEIRPIINQWHKKYPKYDKALLSQRIFDSLLWDKTIVRLEKLLDQFKFNREVLSVDFKSLVKWRHTVAHEGILKNVENIEVDEKLLDAQFVIRLLLLKQIGYTGWVLPNRGYDNKNRIGFYFVD